MGQIRKIGDEYYIEFYARGLLYQQKAGKDRRSAEKLLSETGKKIQEGELLTIVRDVDIDIFLNSFLEHAQKERTVKTFGRFEQTVKHFNAFLNKRFPQLKKLSEITPKVIERYREDLLRSQLKPRTINFTLLLLRDIFEYGIKLGYINDNPALHARFVKDVYRQSPKTVYDEKIEDILNKIASPSEVLETMKSLKETSFKDVSWQILRNSFAKNFLKRGVPLLKLNQILGLDDIAKVMRWWGWNK